MTTEGGPEPDQAGLRDETGLRDEGELREEAEKYLRALAGEHTRLREDQWTAISALVARGQRALVVQRTGWGKSAVYFIATALLRARGAGPTVIVSPLLALMRNQVEAAARAGIRARTINSANPQDWEALYAEVADGQVDVLLVSPERLNNPSFRDQVMPELSRSAGLVVIDEAHCISDWGHDFRPDSRRLRTLLARLSAGIPVLATTATANSRVTRDVAEQLGTGSQGETLVLRGPLDRDSLRLAVVTLPTAHQRLGWLAARLGELPGSGIVYTLTVAAAQETAAFLRDQGMPVAAYSGRDEQADRLQAEDDLLANRVKALVATSALGMGFDKPDLGFVVHLGAPQSPVAYYQQIGRAGRTGTSGRTSPRSPFRRSGRSGPPSRPWPRRAGRCPPACSRRTSTCPAAGWNPCSRCSTWTVPCGTSAVAGRRPASPGTTTRNATSGSPPNAPGSVRRCSATRRRTAAGWSTCAGSSTTPTPRHAGAATTAPASTGEPTCPTPAWPRHATGCSA